MSGAAQIWESRSAVRNVLFVAIAIVLFLLKGQYSGPYRELVHSYGGNVTVSFALYFVFLKLCMMSPRFGRLIAAVAVLACVESFEVMDGFGFMANVYDPFDLLANAIGVGCALGLDTILQKSRSRDSEVNPG
jgi:glucan phosphoethanolaminetransferase (alkaline phosphatase superfamily)